MAETQFAGIEIGQEPEYCVTQAIEYWQQRALTLLPRVYWKITPRTYMMNTIMRTHLPILQGSMAYATSVQIKQIYFQLFLFFTVKF